MPKPRTSGTRNDESTRGKIQVSAGPTLQSQDIVAGLGGAPRDLLATCLALFEDSSLKQRLREWFDASVKATGVKAIVSWNSIDAAPSLQERVYQWKNCPAADDELRLLVWMHLREAFGLSPVTFGSLRSARTAADDLVVSALTAVQPGTLEKAWKQYGWGEEKHVPDSLDALARCTLAELLINVMDDNAPSSAPAREALMQRIRESISHLDKESQDRLLQAINATGFNDDAIRTLLLTGGGLAGFGTAVSVAGFSAYILAAQASALIPLVSGPALVSFVAVLSNPITIVLATTGVGVYAARKANDKIQAAIATRIIALLALNGIAAGDAGLQRMSRTFAFLPELREIGGLSDRVPKQYKDDWRQIAVVHRNAAALDVGLATAMEQPFPGGSGSDRLQRFVENGNAAVQDTVVMATLTMGELLYHMYALDPAVLRAADFSRVEELDNPVMFAAFAHRLDSLDSMGYLGAFSNLKGYTAEQVVANQLVQQGHVVEFPATSNEPGWDIAVDGVRFQVKNAADLSLLSAHFETYDYPILANAEIAEQLAAKVELGQAPDWADKVHFVEGYSQAGVDAMTTQTLEAGDAMLHPHVPVFATTICAFREFNRFCQGQVTGSLAVQEVLISGSIRSGLAVIGNYAGVAIGLLVFGPAGALVLGSALPIVSCTQSAVVKEKVQWATQGKQYRDWEERVRRRLHRLVTVLRDGIEIKIKKLEARVWPTVGNPVADYLHWRTNEEIRFLREVASRLERIREQGKKSVEDATGQLLIWLSTCTLHPAVYQSAFTKWIEALERRPTIGDNVKEKVKRAQDFVTARIGRLSRVLAK